MSIPRHEQRKLDSIEAALHRNDPRLAARLASFGRLTVVDRLLARARMYPRRNRVRRVMWVIVLAALVGMLVTVCLLAGLAVPASATPASTCQANTGLVLRCARSPAPPGHGRAATDGSAEGSKR